MGFDGSSYHPERDWEPRPRRLNPFRTHFFAYVASAAMWVAGGAAFYYGGKAIFDGVSERMHEAKMARLLNELECMPPSVPVPDSRCD